MSYDNRKVAHLLFYLKDSGRDVRRGYNFRIERHKGCTVALSFSKPIAVYPDKGGYVLLDTDSYSLGTSRHLEYIRQAIPCDVEDISFSWFNCNRECWEYDWDTYEKMFPRFMKKLEEKVGELCEGKEHQYVYSKERKQILHVLQNLRAMFSRFGRKRAVKAVDRKVAFINDPARIKAGQQHFAAARARERETREREDRERSIADEVWSFLKRSGDMRERLKRRAATLLERYPLVLLQDFANLAKYVKINGACDQMVGVMARAMNAELMQAWIEAHPLIGMDKACDLCFSTLSGRFVTSKHVNIGYDELQRCLNLWKRGRFAGCLVDKIYRVIRSNEFELVIGCHIFPREVVEQIYARYAGKTLEVIRKEEEELGICYRADVTAAIQIVTEEVAMAMVRDTEAAAALRKIGALQLEPA